MSNNDKLSALDKWKVSKVIPKSGIDPLATPEWTKSSSVVPNTQDRPPIPPTTPVDNLPPTAVKSKYESNTNAAPKKDHSEEEIYDFSAAARSKSPRSSPPPRLDTPSSPLDEDGNKKAIYALDTITRLFEIVEKNSLKSHTPDQKSMVVMDLLAQATNRLPDYLALFDSNPSDWIRGKAMNQLVFYAANNWKTTGQMNLDQFIDLASQFFNKAHGDQFSVARKVVSDLVSGATQRNHVPEVFSALNDIKIEEMKAEQKIYDRLEYAFDFFADNKYDVVQLLLSVNRDLIQEDIIPKQNIQNGPLHQLLFLKGRQVAICARMVLASFEQIAKDAKESLRLISGDALEQRKAELKGSLYDGTLEMALREKSYDLLKNSLSGSNIFLDAMRNEFQNRDEHARHP